jgi:hypothetical protein
MRDLAGTEKDYEGRWRLLRVAAPKLLMARDIVGCRQVPDTL